MDILIKKYKTVCHLNLQLVWCYYFASYKNNDMNFFISTNNIFVLYNRI